MLSQGESWTDPGTVLRISITIRRAGDKVDVEPGFFEGGTAAHCRPPSKAGSPES